MIRLNNDGDKDILDAIQDFRQRRREQGLPDWPSARRLSCGERQTIAQRMFGNFDYWELVPQNIMEYEGSVCLPGDITTIEQRRQRVGEL